MKISLNRIKSRLDNAGKKVREFKYTAVKFSLN